MMPHDASAAMGTCLPAANTWSSYGIKDNCAPNKCHTMTKTSYIHAHIWSYMYISVHILYISMISNDFIIFIWFHMISYDFHVATQRVSKPFGYLWGRDFWGPTRCHLPSRSSTPWSLARTSLGWAMVVGSSSHGIVMGSMRDIWAAGLAGGGHEDEHQTLEHLTSAEI